MNLWIDSKIWCSQIRNFTFEYFDMRCVVVYGYVSFHYLLMVDKFAQPIRFDVFVSLAEENDIYAISLKTKMKTFLDMQVCSNAVFLASVA